MKIILFVALLAFLPIQSLRADEASARSGRSSENSPVVSSGQGEGDLMLDTEKPVRSAKPDPSLNKQLNALCKADSNPDECKENTKADLKKIKSKKKKKSDDAPAIEEK